MLVAGSTFRHRAERMSKGYGDCADYSGIDCGFLRGNATRKEAPDLDSTGPSSDVVAPFGTTSVGFE